MSVAMDDEMTEEVKPTKRYGSSLEKMERFWGLLLTAPYIIGLLVFAAGPIMFSFLLGFYRWDNLSAPEFIGLQNWSTLFGDALFWKSVSNTLYFVVGTVPTGVALSLILAALLVQPSRLQTFFRTIYFLPVVTSNVAIALVWTWFYDSNYGVMNYVIGKVTLLFLGHETSPIHWLNDPATAMPAIMIMTIWKGLGYNMIIFLAALQGVPKSLYESADIDGAGFIAKFFHITIPQIAPIIFFVVVVSTITGFQVFEQVYIMARDGRPANSTMTIVYYLYQNAFTNREMGYASTIGTMLFAMIFIVTMFQLLGRKMWNRD